MIYYWEDWSILCKQYSNAELKLLMGKDVHCMLLGEKGIKWNDPNYNENIRNIYV